MREPRDAIRAWLDLLGASNAIKKSVDTQLRSEFGVSISRFDILSALERAGPDGLRAGVLSQQLMVTEGNTTQVTAPLIRDGLVKRNAGRDDARIAIFTLTKKGERLFSKMAADHNHWIGSVFSDLSKSEIAAFRRILRKLNIPNNAAQPGKDAA
ncbi:hypothetical protein MNBD_ALPHA05-2387 [hydrothermal vent metagenome]|uniref:HTH marR-type domain-containing protein n=1 Tax=hydrothermal vent metagenome TaxID=652676 RepID=A0A3B0SNX3_9ZZZZ